MMQNAGHIRALKSYIQNDYLPIYSYIVFGNKCVLDDIHLSSGEHLVINQRDILNSIQRNITSHDNGLTRTQIDELYDLLYPLTKVDLSIKISHVESIQSKLQRERNPLPDTIYSGAKKCPRCGKYVKISFVINSENHKNKFLECSDYPRCGFRRKLE